MDKDALQHLQATGRAALLCGEGEGITNSSKLEPNGCTVELQRSWFVSPSMTTTWRTWDRIFSEATRRLRYYGSSRQTVPRGSLLAATRMICEPQYVSSKTSNCETSKPRPRQALRQRPSSSRNSHLPPGLIASRYLSFTNAFWISAACLLSSALSCVLGNSTVQ